MQDVKTLLEQAVSHLQQGRPDAAEPLLRSVLASEPGHAEAHHLSGIMAMQRGDHEAAVVSLERAISENPGVAMAHCNLGYALMSLGRLPEALAVSHRAAEIAPGLPEAHVILGNVLNASGKVDEAITAWSEAIRLRPTDTIRLYRRGYALLVMRRLDEAEADFRRVISLDPGHADAWKDLSVLLSNTHRPEEAVAAADQALRLRPDFPLAHNCRAAALRALRKLDEALQSCERATTLAPDYSHAWFNLGTIRHARGESQAAEACYRRALELTPGDPGLHSNLLFMQVARACLGHDEMLQALCEWDRVHGKEARERGLYSAEHRKSGLAGRRLRVGYISPDLRNHVVRFFLEPLLSAHDRQRFEIFCYACLPPARGDAVTQRLRGLTDAWRFVDAMSDAEVANMIHDDGIDVLVDLAGHTSGNRLRVFTWRPAPVQVTYLGFFASTGLATMDYWLTDTVLHPVDSLERSTEKIYRLPRCWVCYRPSDQAPALTPCPSPGDAVVYGVFNHLSKLSDLAIETWSRLLHQLPDSRLLVMARQFSTPSLRDELPPKFRLPRVT